MEGPWLQLLFPIQWVPNCCSPGVWGGTSSDSLTPSPPKEVGYTKTQGKASPCRPHLHAISECLLGSRGQGLQTGSPTTWEGTSQEAKAPAGPVSPPITSSPTCP